MFVRPIFISPYFSSRRSFKPRHGVAGQAGITMTSLIGDLSALFGMPAALPAQVHAAAI
jgi:hypothetical protein